MSEAWAPHEARSALQRAVAAVPWELQAATSLARLWRDQHRVAEARNLLATVYGDSPTVSKQQTCERRKSC
jgi:hypothetical protein